MPLARTMPTPARGPASSTRRCPTTPAPRRARSLTECQIRWRNEPPLAVRHGVPHRCPDNNLAPVGDWWIAEYRPETGEAFGYASLGIPGCAEWGYIALDELERRNTRGVVVERD